MFSVRGPIIKVKVMVGNECLFSFCPCSFMIAILFGDLFFERVDAGYQDQEKILSWQLNTLTN